MTIGIALNKAQLDADMGTAVLELVGFMRKAQQLQELFAIHPDPDFTAIGYVAAEVTTLRSAWATDGPQLIQIITGAAALAAAKDFRANLFQMMGDGLA